MGHGIMFYKCGQGDAFMDDLAGFCQRDYDSLNRPRSEFEVQVFSDQNWAGCNVTRTSTTSFMVFRCGTLIKSSCRTQTSIALSSCEAELLARTAAVAEFTTLDSASMFIFSQESVI